MPTPNHQDGFYDPNNSATTSLANAAVYTGTFTDVTNFGWLSITVTRDNTAGAGDTVQLSWSIDGTTELYAETYAQTQAVGVITVPATLPFFRLIVTNNSGSAESVTTAVVARPGVGPIGFSSGLSSTDAYKKGTFGALVAGIRNESSGAFTTSDGNFSPLAVDRSGRVFIVPQLYSAQDPGLSLDGSLGSYAEAPDAAGLQITGDIELRAAANPKTWSPPSTYFLLDKMSSTLTSGYNFFMLGAGSNTLGVQWVDSGGTIHQANSTSGITSNGPLLIRVTLDVDNGAAGRDIKFYTKAYVAGTVTADLASNSGWTQLGSTVTQAGTTSIKSGNANLRLGGQAGAPASYRFNGTIYGIVIQSGLAGTEKANPDFAAATIGATTVTDGHSNTFTLYGTAAIVGNQYISTPADPQGAMYTSPGNGYVMGKQVKNAVVDASVTNGNYSVVAAVTGKKIRVLSFELSVNGSLVTKFTDGSGGSTLAGVYYGSTNTTVPQAAPAGTFLFETTAGNALFANSNAATARSIRVSYIEI